MKVMSVYAKNLKSSMSISRVYVTLGSNIEPEKNLVAAVHLLRQTEEVLLLSSVYQTPPQGFAHQADFLNMAVALRTNQTIEVFKTDVLAQIEHQLKRVRDPQNKNAPRTIDLDIALWDETIQDYGAKPWHVPDPDIVRFGHVALPLAEIAPAYLHPENGQTLAQIAAQFDASAFILRPNIVS